MLIEMVKGLKERAASTSCDSLIGYKFQMTRSLLVVYSKQQQQQQQLHFYPLVRNSIDYIHV